MKREFWTSATLAAAVIAVAIGGPWLVNEMRTLPSRHAIAARASQRIVTLDVGGMTCAMCSAKIQSELGAVPGVAAVDVRLAQQQAVVVCAKSVPDSALVAAIARAGPGFLAAPARN
jgi:copper chaperone CopZ